MTQPPPSSYVSPTAPAEAKPKPHVLSIIALVTAAVGFLFACVPGALIVGWVLLPISFVLSLVAMFLKGRKWPAITGLIVAVVGTIVGFVVFFTLVVNAANDAFDKASAPAGQPSRSSEEADSHTAADSKAGAADSAYVVSIGDAKKTKDYDGKPALVVNFTFTNNSDKDASFMSAVMPKAFQDGIELDSAIVMNESDDATGSLKDIKPGKSIKVQSSYLLDGNDPVKVEVKELFSFDETLLATKSFDVK